MISYNDIVFSLLVIGRNFAFVNLRAWTEESDKVIGGIMDARWIRTHNQMTDPLYAAHTLVNVTPQMFDNTYN